MHPTSAPARDKQCIDSQLVNCYWRFDRNETKSSSCSAVRISLKFCGIKPAAQGPVGQPSAITALGLTIDWYISSESSRDPIPFKFGPTCPLAPTVSKTWQAPHPPTLLNTVAPGPKLAFPVGLIAPGIGVGVGSASTPGLSHDAFTIWPSDTSTHSEGVGVGSTAQAAKNTKKAPSMSMAA